MLDNNIKQVSMQVVIFGLTIMNKNSICKFQTSRG